MPAFVLYLSLRQSNFPFPLYSSLFLVFGREYDATRAADRLCVCVAQKPLGARIPTSNRAIEIQSEYGVIFGTLNNQTEAGFTLAQGDFCLEAIGDVNTGTDVAQEIAF